MPGKYEAEVDATGSCDGPGRGEKTDADNWGDGEERGRLKSRTGEGRAGDELYGGIDSLLGRE